MLNLIVRTGCDSKELTRGKTEKGNSAGAVEREEEEKSRKDISKHAMEIKTPRKTVNSIYRKELMTKAKKKKKLKKATGNVSLFYP